MKLNVLLLPDWHDTERTSTGSDPRRRFNSISRSERFLVDSERLKRYHADELDVSASETIGYRISAPPDDLRLSSFLRFFDLPLQLLRLFADDEFSHGTDPRL